MSDYKTPGVYVEESTGLSLSIQTGETAIPVFAFDEADFTSWAKEPTKSAEVTPLSSWLDVQQIVDTNKDKADGDNKPKKTAISHLYQSLNLFFMNGGGRCYIAPVGKLDTLVSGIDDVTLVVQAGTPYATFNTEALKLCKQGSTSFAIFDGPETALTDKAAVQSAQNNLSNVGAYGAAYYPWLKVPGLDKSVPPSGAVAGVYARTDRERGVWKAPANVAISGAVPTYAVSDEVDGACNAPDNGGKSINVIRQFRGVGTLVWGARTLGSNDNNWKYVPVRRFFSAAEKDIRAALNTAVFEPNSAPTWERVRSAVDSYLHSLWKQGALQGDTPAQAYYVQIGLNLTMSQEDINNGKMVLKVGLAAVRPAEFIILELSQDVTGG